MRNTLLAQGVNKKYNVRNNTKIHIFLQEQTTIYKN